MSDGMRGRDRFAKYRGAIGALTKLYKLTPLGMRLRAFEKRRSTRGKIGLGLRYAILSSVAVSVGENVAIYPGVYLLHPENLKVGSNVSIQPMCYLKCGLEKGGIEIGDDVSIAHGATVMATTHTFGDKEVMIRDQEVVSEPVVIESNVWIGAKASVLSGVTVKSGCVIGAGAVVTKSTEPNGVYGGVPAKRIKER